MTATLTESLSAPVQKFGLASFQHNDNIAMDVKVDRLAYDTTTLMMISVVAEPMRIKAIRAILHAKNGTPQIRVAGVQARFPSGGDLSRSRVPNLSIDKSGYETYAVKLEYGMTHVMFMSKSDSFIRFLSPESIWQKLKTSRFATPLLESWMPWVTARLIEKKHLRECSCYRANCGVLDNVKEEVLDEIISRGVRDGHLVIP